MESVAPLARYARGEKEMILKMIYHSPVMTAKTALAAVVALPHLAISLVVLPHLALMVVFLPCHLAVTPTVVVQVLLHPATRVESRPQRHPFRLLKVVVLRKSFDCFPLSLTEFVHSSSAASSSDGSAAPAAPTADKKNGVVQMSPRNYFVVVLGALLGLTIQFQ